MESPATNVVPSNTELALALSTVGLPFVGELAVGASVLQNPVGDESWSVLLAASVLPLVGKALFGASWYVSAVMLTARWMQRPCPLLGRLWVRLWLPALAVLLMVQAGLQMCLLPGLLFGLCGVLFLDPVAQAHGRVPSFRIPHGQVMRLGTIWFGWAAWICVASSSTHGLGALADDAPAIWSILDHLAWLVAAVAWCLSLRLVEGSVDG
ncbi:MAG: hypothetical protein CL927_12715 [Deltaproteobacteria bacterium]|nr:hypothetical protein [Deltaproteobacteria bacterium]